MKKIHKVVPILFLSTTLSIFSFPVFAKSKSTPSHSAGPLQIHSLQNKIDQLEKNQKILERKFEVEQEKLAEKEKEKAKEATVVSAGKDGFSIKSGSGDFSLKIKGLLQTDGRFYLGDAGDKFANQFVLRRVRPIFEGTLFKYFDYRLIPDFGGGQAVIQDAYADIHPLKELRFRVGKFKQPVGLVQLQSDSDATFIEKGPAATLTPNRDLGVQVHGQIADGVLSYAAGLFNGVNDGANSDGDVSDGKDVSGRIFSEPFKKTKWEPLKGFGIGIGGSYGSQFGSASAPNLPTYKSIGQQTIFSYLSDPADATRTAISNGKRYRLSPQGFYYWGGFGLLGEYVLSYQNVAINGTPLRLLHKGWQGEASYVLTGEKKAYTGVTPKYPFNPKKGRWGAVEVAGRFGETIFDPNAFPNFANPSKSVRKAISFGGGVTWYLNQSLRLAVNYDQTLYRGGASGGNRPTEKALFTRLQLSY